MIVHELKLQNPGFTDILEGRKHFEWRANDRNYQQGDLLVLREYDANVVTGGGQYPEHQGAYTGKVLVMGVGYPMYGGHYGLPEGYCVMELTRLAYYSAHPGIPWGTLPVRP
ncbi:MAG: DUF3850 domain-containing protein [Dehalococcoidia bacterium]|nr:DUF3850 domain-containing protein [Dehalococcoidia bacterium]